MCRLLAIKSTHPIKIVEHLENFARISKNSSEYQGHGWGLAYLDQDNHWKVHKNINPIWESNVTIDAESSIFLIHARSAFKDEGIAIENNMPFISDSLAYIFNGELRGVRIKEDGRIGAEKIFNFIKKFTDSKESELVLNEAIDKGVTIINRRTEYIRAMNMVMSDGSDLYIYSQYSEDPDYFTLHKTSNGHVTIISSEPYGPYQWRAIETGQVEVV